MSRKTPPGGPIWLQWTRTIVLFLLLAEYVRLFLTSEQATYRVVVVGLLAIGFFISLLSLVRAMRARSRSEASSGPDSDEAR